MHLKTFIILKCGGVDKGVCNFQNESLEDLKKKKKLNK